MADRNYRGRGGGSGRGGYRGRGGGYRGRGRGGRSRGFRNYNTPRNIAHTGQGLESFLISLDGAGYGAYKQLKSIEWNFNNDFILFFDRIQSDPFAPASNLRVRLFNKTANIPSSLFNNKIRNIASCDYLTRQFANICRKYDYDRRATGPWSAKKGGDLLINNPRQYVIERTSCFITTEYVEVRFDCALPGKGRKIEGIWCADVLCKNLPFVITNSLYYRNLNKTEFEHHVNCVEDQQYLRQVVLPKLGLVAFIANNSVLPRQSGVSDKPMKKSDGAVPFMYDKQQENDNKEADMLFIDGIKLKNNKKIILCGLGIPSGVTLIIGGGFHGKSTLLNALQYGIYNNVPGDGREYVSCVSNAIAIRSEDRRFINNVNITPFINNLPQNKSCAAFSTLNASGSTSMAANIMEGIEMKTKCVLIDEDTSATNFMVRDCIMDKLVINKTINEPITPFICKINALYKQLDVSSILVIGGVGSYFEVANHVILMNNYKPTNITKKAKLLVNNSENGLYQYNKFGHISARYLKCNSFESASNIKIKVDGQKIIYGNDVIDLGFISQIVERGQLDAIGRCLEYIKQHIVSHNKEMSVCRVLNAINNALNSDYINTKMDVLNKVRNVRYAHSLSNKLVRPRLIEIVAALNRLRSLNVYSNVDKKNNNNNND